MNTFNITLDLNKSNVTTPIRLRQGDLDGTTITALILDHGATADLTGLLARFVMELPGGEHYYRKDATVGEGSVTVTINEEQAASVTGRTTRAYFQLLDGETVRASTGSVTVDILPDALEGHTVPADYDSAIQDAIDALDDAVENIADTVEDVLADHPEWTTTVQDGAVTDAKLYQGTDGILARNARLMYRLDNLLTGDTGEQEVAVVADAAKTPLAGLSLYGRSMQDGTPTPSAPVAIQSVTPNIAVTPYTHFDYVSSRGVAYTQNADGSITASGTAGSQLAYLGLCTHSDNTFGLERGKTYTLVVSSGNVTLLTITGGGSNNKVAVVTVPTSGNWTVGVGVLAGSTVNETFRFSVFEGDVTALSPVPYNSVGLFAVGRNLVSDLQINTAENPSTSAGVSFQRNSDGSLRIYGTATGNSMFDGNYRRGFITVPIKRAGTYTVSLSPTGSVGGLTTYVLYRRRTITNQESPVANMTGQASLTFTLTEAQLANGDLFSIGFSVANGTTIDVTVYPQLEVGSTATAYQPYTATVTPIDLDGHELRSLPDGTRDEVTVDQYGHAVLIQRVGVLTVDGSNYVPWFSMSGTYTRFGLSIPNVAACILLADKLATTNNYDIASLLTNPYSIATITDNRVYFSLSASETTVDQAKALLQSNPVTINYKLATPQTIDLGTIDPIALQGPDLTAQTVPTAPFALTYERDLNTTLARLEAAIAALA